MGTSMAELNYMQRSRLHGYRSALRRRNLIQDARVERQHHQEELRDLAAKHREFLGKETGEKEVLEKLNDEGVELIWESHDGIMNFAVVLACQGSRRFLSDLIFVLEDECVMLKHLETRMLENKKNQNFDLLIRCESNKNQFLKAARKLEENPVLKKLVLYKDDQIEQSPWFPSHISDLDKCNHIVINYEPEIDSRHPAYGDEMYIRRRTEIARIAMEYKQGNPIQRVQYTPSETGTWREVYTKLRELHGSHACNQYNENIKILEEELGYGPDEVPQQEDVSKFLKRKTGFQLRPCAGLLSARDFLASLAFRVFQATQYIRHASVPHHTPEPDAIHELIGHVPMFADPNFAQFSQEIGLASLGASDEDIEKLATVYWFSVEFGLCKEGNETKACGAGLLSAFGELQHAISGKPELKSFDPSITALTPYQDDYYQPLYYVAESVEDAMNKFRRWARTIKRQFSVFYDPYTQSVHKVHHPEELGPGLERLQADMSAMGNTILALRK